MCSIIYSEPDMALHARQCLILENFSRVFINLFDISNVGCIPFVRQRFEIKSPANLAFGRGLNCAF